MVLNEISSKIKRTIRGINIKDTLGMHYYKLGAVGMAYWEIRLKEAKDLDEASYCRAQLEKCKIDRYKKKYRGLERWEIKDRLNNGNRIVMVCDLPDSIAEEIMDYSLKLIEEEMK